MDPVDDGACASVIPPAAVAALGWDDSVPARSGLGGCTWEGLDGVLAVASEASGFEEACAAIEPTPREGRYDVTAEVDGVEQACSYVRDDDRGMSQLVVETSQGTVVGIRVAPVGTPTSSDLVEAALTALAANADLVA